MTRTTATLPGIILALGLLPVVAVGQVPDETQATGVSFGVFLFNSGLRPGIVIDRPLEWSAERGATFEGWVSLVPDSGAGTGLGVTFGRGVLRSGLGLAAVRASGDFGIGPGFQVGFDAPVDNRESGTRLRGSFHAYFTSAGYLPMLRLTLGSFRVGGSGPAS